eukprot:1153567-Pelagomonas_calceolata.AAC.5
MMPAPHTACNQHRVAALQSFVRIFWPGQDLIATFLPCMDLADLRYDPIAQGLKAPSYSKVQLEGGHISHFIFQY